MNQFFSVSVKARKDQCPNSAVMWVTLPLLEGGCAFFLIRPSRIRASTLVREDKLLYPVYRTPNHRHTQKRVCPGIWAPCAQSS